MLFPQNKNSLILASVWAWLKCFSLKPGSLFWNLMLSPKPTRQQWTQLPWLLYTVPITLSVVWKENKQKSTNERACLPASANWADSATLHLYKSQPDNGVRCGLVNLWETFRTQVALVRYGSWSHICMGYTLHFKNSGTFPTLVLPCLLRPFTLLSGPWLKIPQVI